ncbi:hypothetical protein RhiirA5_438309 [Rhizophagus irregularis]|uniref:Uncharacterized protein n=1 Tax=Rhizophagus irregularis TaxID=588596 RepID=A0A2N0NJB4_9GLOM|nr:hypothetical protein RhiirA5_438309 [Rhizophagus irregularis]
MDTGWLNCENGDPNLIFHSRDITANLYNLHAKVMGSLRKTKNRGPFTSDTCFKLSGNLALFALYSLRRPFFYKIS